MHRNRTACIAKYWKCEAILSVVPASWEFWLSRSAAKETYDTSHVAPVEVCSESISHNCETFRQAPVGTEWSVDPANGFKELMKMICPVVLSREGIHKKQTREIRIRPLYAIRCVEVLQDIFPDLRRYKNVAFDISSHINL
ncbi:hypothetical protein ACN47E_007167 [Coniothyrium glycines]